MKWTGPKLRIDRTSPVPLYFQVAQALEAAVESGELPHGTRLENEIALADQLGLSRPTMRRAIQYLVDKGLLVRKREVGTQVVQTRVKRSIELTSLYDDLAKARQRPRTKVLRNEVEAATDQIALALGVPAGVPVIVLERLRYANDEPIALLRNYLPTDLVSFRNEALEEHGLYQLLRQTGIQLRVATQTIGAKAARTAEARLLDETRGAPLLTMTRTTFADSGRAVEYGTHIYRSGLYSFELTLVGN